MSDVNKIRVSDSNYEQRVEGWLEEDLGDVEDSDTDPNYAIQSDPTQIGSLHQTTKLQNSRVKEKSLHSTEIRI
jgi:hypothetical protein